MGAFPDLTAVYSVSIASHSLDRSWLLPQNPPVLLGDAARPDASINIPRAQGGIARPSNPGVFKETLFLHVTGDFTSAGAPSSDHRATLVDNVHWLRTNVFRATPDAEGTVALSVVDPAGATWSGRIQLLSFDQGNTMESQGLIYRRVALGFLVPRPLTRTLL